jgi:hypothetical protein
MSANESVLDDFLGIGVIFQNIESGPGQADAISRHNFDKRAFVSRVETTYQTGIIEGGLPDGR